MKVLHKIGLICVLLGLSASLSYAQYVPKEKRKKKNANTEQTTSPTPKPQPKNEKQDKKSKKSNNSGELSEMSFGERLSFGGNFGLSGFGNDIFTVDVAPLVGYRFSERFTGGIGANYTYYRIRRRINGQTFTNESSFYGGRVYGQYSIIPEIFAWAEVEGLNGEFFDPTQDDFRRDWQISPLVGAGVQQSFSGKGGLYFVVLYDLNYSENRSFRGSPWVTRVGFNF